MIHVGTIVLMKFTLCETFFCSVFCPLAVGWCDGFEICSTSSLKRMIWYAIRSYAPRRYLSSEAQLLDGLLRIAFSSSRMPVHTSMHSSSALKTASVLGTSPVLQQEMCSNQKCSTRRLPCSTGNSHTQICLVGRMLHIVQPWDVLSDKISLGYFQWRHVASHLSQQRTDRVVIVVVVCSKFLIKAIFVFMQSSKLFFHFSRACPMYSTNVLCLFIHVLHE